MSTARDDAPPPGAQQRTCTPMIFRPDGGLPITAVAGAVVGERRCRPVSESHVVRSLEAAFAPTPYRAAFNEQRKAR